MRPLILSVILLSVCTGAIAQQPKPKHKKNPPIKPTGSYAVETPAQFAKRTQWWRDAKFGMFIHWGVYAVPADATDKAGNKGIAEWYFSNKQMQMKDYEKFAARFNPVRFDAKRWVQTAKNAGMKYIVITSKHHDGFDMFGTKLNHDWNIVDATPFKRDPIKELAAECRRQGVKLCFYHSIMDWHNPDYLPRRPSVKPCGGISCSGVPKSPRNCSPLFIHCMPCRPLSTRLLTRMEGWSERT
jgi:alpha-L-fucosidase